MTKSTLTTGAGAPVADKQNSRAAGPTGPIEKLAHQNPERIMASVSK
jgi:catalase